MNIGPIVGLLLIGGACDTADPGEGGFFAGLSALSNDCYEQRIEEREQGVEQQETRQDELRKQQEDVGAASAAAAAELDRLKGEHTALKRQIVALKSDLAARRVALDSETEAEVKSALVATGGGGSEAERISSLQSAIGDARALVEKLSGL